jgi:hypothetical protein
MGTEFFGKLKTHKYKLYPAVDFHKKIYRDFKEIREDAERWIEEYNTGNTFWKVLLRKYTPTDFFWIAKTWWKTRC